jgi:hypothetical protein
MRSFPFMGAISSLLVLLTPQSQIGSNAQVSPSRLIKLSPDGEKTAAMEEKSSDQRLLRDLDQLRNFPEKRRKLSQAGNEARYQLDRVYTPEQMEKIRRGLQSEQDPQAIWDSLNLSQDQKDSIQQIGQASRQQMQAVLDEE